MHGRCRVDCRMIWSVPVPPTNLSGGALLVTAPEHHLPKSVGCCSSNDCWRFERKIDRQLHFGGACIPCWRRRLWVVAKPFWRLLGVGPPCLYRRRFDSKSPKCLRSIGWRWPCRKSHRQGFLGIVHQSMPRRLLPSTDSLDPWADGSRAWNTTNWRRRNNEIPNTKRSNQDEWINKAAGLTIS